MKTTYSLPNFDSLSSFVMPSKERIRLDESQRFGEVISVDVAMGSCLLLQLPTSKVSAAGPQTKG